MLNYIIKRIILSLITIFILIFIVYMLMVNFLPIPITPGPDTDQDAYLEILRTYNLDRSSIERFGIYIGDIFSRGYFGDIYQPGLYGADVGTTIPDVFFRPLQYTLLLSIPSFAISAILGPILGFVAGYKRGRWPDYLINIFVTLITAIPVIVIVPIALEYASRDGVPLLFNNSLSFTESLRVLIMPIVLSGVAGSAIFTLYIRNEVVDVLARDYIKVAKSKGLNEFEILFKHVIRNVMVPNIGLFIFGFTTILGGSLVFERLFLIPGIAGVTISAVSANDVNVVMFSIIFLTGIAFALRIVIDVSYTILDPRIRFVSKGNFIFNKVQQRVKGRINRKQISADYEK